MLENRAQGSCWKVSNVIYETLIPNTSVKEATWLRGRDTRKICKEKTGCKHVDWIEVAQNRSNNRS